MSICKIFITGGTGRIGRFLTESLKSKEYDITLLCTKETCLYDSPNIRCVLGDIINPPSYSKELKGIDTVVHMSGLTHTNDISEYYEVNTKATASLIRECENYGVKRFIFISTRAISEKGGHYSLSKLKAEEFVKKSALDWVVLRPAEVYGTAGEAGINMLLNNISKFPFIPIIGNGKYKVAPVHVSDVIFSIIKTIEKSDIKNKIYTIAGPENISYDEFVDKVLRLKGIKKNKLHIPVCLSSLLLQIFMLFKKDLFVKDQIPRLISEKSADISLAIKDLDFMPKAISYIYRDEKN